MSTIRCLPFVILLAFGAISAQSVHVVDLGGAPGADFASVQEAVDAAANGDVLLVRSGTYFENVEIDAKSLVIQEEAGGAVAFGSLEVRNIPATGFVTVRGVQLDGVAIGVEPSLRTLDCAGPVWFEDVLVVGDNPFFSGRGECTNSADVVFVRCHFEQPFDIGGCCAPTTTFDIVASSVSMFETTVEGLDGDSNLGFLVEPGLDAIRMIDGELFLVGSNIIGGTGADGALTCQAGAAGGAAIVLDGTHPAVTVLDSTVHGGAGGVGTGGCSDGSPGLAFVTNAVAASVDLKTGNARGYAVSSPVRENATVQVSFAGQPGDRVWVRVSMKPGPSLVSRFWDGPFVIGLPAARKFIGTLDASGQLVLSTPLPPFGPGVESIAFHTQAIFLGSRFVMSSPSALVGLDSSF
jgi:hypothetical protein